MTDAQEPDDAAPLRFELLQADDYSRYLIRAKSEILFLLRALEKHNTLISLYFNEGNDHLLTSVLALSQSGERMALDYGGDEETNAKALASDKLVCVTSFERVKIQFVLHGVAAIEHQERPAFGARVPDSLLRLQRREYFRLVTPLARPLKCLIPIDGGKRTVEAQIMDISGGGLAVMGPADGIPLQPQMQFSDCRIDLPEIGAVTARLRVRSMFEVTLASGVRVKRFGCEFVYLPSSMLNLVQRYILKVERERKARESGLA